MVVTKKTNPVKVRDEAKYEHAFLLFQQNVAQAEIARKVGIAEKTLTRWVNANDWRARRAAANVTRDELVNKTLKLIDQVLQQAIDNKDVASVADKLSKLAGAIRNLDKQASVVDVVQVFIVFNKWLINRQHDDPELTDQLIRTVNRYQDMFVSEKLSLQNQ